MDDAQGIVLLNNDGTTTDLLKIAENAPEGSTFKTLNGSGSALSFSFNGETFVVDTKNKKAVAFTEPQDSYLAGLAHCGDTVTWTYTDANGEGVASQYVYNADKQTLRAVKEPELFGNSLCQGEYLAWSVRDSSNDSALATDVVTQVEGMTLPEAAASLSNPGHVAVTESFQVWHRWPDAKRNWMRR